jgi:hypothetical protein
MLHCFAEVVLLDPLCREITSHKWKRTVAGESDEPFTLGIKPKLRDLWSRGRLESLLVSRSRSGPDEHKTYSKLFWGTGFMCSSELILET